MPLASYPRQPSPTAIVAHALRNLVIMALPEGLLRAVLDRALGRGRASERCCSQIRRLSSACRSSVRLRDCHHRVLFIHMHGSNYLLTLEAVLQNRLRLEGIEPSYLTCSSLPWCNNRRFFGVPDHSEMCSDCNKRNGHHSHLVGSDLRSLAEYETTGIRGMAADATDHLSLSDCLGFVWNGIPLGELCEVSASRYLCREVRNINRESDLWYFRRFVESGIILADSLAHALDSLTPTVIVQNSGRFFWYAIADFIARQKGIGVVSYEGDGGFGKTWMFRAKVPVSSLEIGELWAPKNGGELTLEEERELDSLLQARRSGSMIKGFSDNKAFAFSHDLPPLINEIRGPVVAMFTNLTFDSQVAGRHTIFNGVIDWIVYTIGRAKACPVTFVLRIHPAEAQEHEGEYSRERVLDELRDRDIEVPSNVIIIPPAERVNSYALAERAALSVVYTSTIGLELLLAGHQVIVCGRAHYAGKGFGITPITKEEYLWYLVRVNDRMIPSEKEVRLARSYGHAFWFRATRPLRAFTTRGRFQVAELLLDAPSRIARGANREVDAAIDLILSESGSCCGRLRSAAAGGESE